MVVSSSSSCCYYCKNFCLNLLEYFLPTLNSLTANVSTKSQMISEQNCEVSNFQKNNEIVVRISALAFKMGKILLYHIILNEQNIPGAGFC